MNQLKNKIFCGGNLEVVASWPSNFVSAICTDPPYGLGFMGKDWDTFKQENIKERKYELVWKQENRNKPPKLTRDTFDSGARHAGSYDLSRNPEFQQWFMVWAKAMLRITKPGGFLLCFGGTRTVHRLTCAIEDAGWEIRDCMMWLYGSGFPKSHNISKAIDKAAGAKRGRIKFAQSNSWREKENRQDRQETVSDNNAITPLSKLWDGYGTALKPAWEPIIVAMKPLDGTFAHNAETHGVAGLNIDGGRIGTEGGGTHCNNRDESGKCLGHKNAGRSTSGETFHGPDTTGGRWPANLILDEEAAAMLDEQTQNVGNTKPHKVKSNVDKYDGYGSITHKQGEVVNYNEPDTKGASRFFYCAKCSRKERNMGLDDQSGKKVNDGRQTPIDNPYQRGETIRRNTHPTVKPLALMKYLCTLLKMPSAGQIILDPFLGSGTTGIACKELGINFIGIEKEAEYCEIAVKRIAAVEGQEITLHTDNPPAEVPHSISAPDEHRQSIINAAVVALKRNQK